MQLKLFRYTAAAITGSVFRFMWRKYASAEQSVWGKPQRHRSHDSFAHACSRQARGGPASGMPGCKSRSDLGRRVAATANLCTRREGQHNYKIEASKHNCKHYIP